MQTIVSPLYLIIPRKTKADKKISMNLNWYRNSQHFEQNTVKKMYRDLVEGQIENKTIQTPMGITYKLFYSHKSDLMGRGAIIDKFFQDVLVEMKLIPDDNVEFVVETHFVVGGKDKENPRMEINII